MIKTLTVCGTRPEIIRLSETIKKLDRYTNNIVVFTNQSYSPMLGSMFFKELGLREPDYCLNVKAKTVGQQIANILRQCEQVLLSETPDALLVLGDTNSALSCIVAKRLKIPVFHWEAGNRCFDDRVPEEINRRIVDHTADINMCYTEHARRNLLREGIDPQYVFVTGSPLVEVYQKLTKIVMRAPGEEPFQMEGLKLQRKKYFLASIHREENVMDGESLRAITDALNHLCDKYKVPVIMSTHPRTRKRIGDARIKTGRIRLHAPFGVATYVSLQRNALCCLSDSGTIHEDAAILGIPAVNIRNTHERPEAYDSGNVVMSGVSVEGILDAVELVLAQSERGIRSSNPYGDFQSERGIRYSNPYGDFDCSNKVVRLILSYHGIVRERKYRL